MLVIHCLLWDDRNVGHIARHTVTPEEVEAVCHGDHIVLESYEERLVVIGPTLANRVLAVVIEPTGAPAEGMYYVVTDRPASQRERRRYQSKRGGAKR